MERRSIPKAENRLLILYALHRLGPATGMQLWQFMAEYDLVNYFSLQLGLAEMQEQGQLKEHAHPLGSLLTVTDIGAYTLGAFDHRIPISRRQLIDREAPAWHERFRLEQQTPAESCPMPDGTLCLRLRLMEGDTTLMDILLRRPRSQPITFLQERWRSIAQRVYETVTMTLMAGFQEDAPLPEALPDGITLQRATQQDWMLSMEEGGMTLMLFLPDERLARWCAQLWPENGPRLREDTLGWLLAATPAP